MPFKRMADNFSSMGCSSIFGVLLFEVLCAANVVVRLRWRWVARPLQWLAIECVLENRLDTAVAARANPYGTFGSRFHAGWRVFPGESDQAQASAITHLRMRLVGHDAF